jgi:hypothetical protein
MKVDVPPPAVFEGGCEATANRAKPEDAGASACDFYR